MLTISVWPRRLKEFLLAHPLYKSPPTYTQYAQIPLRLQPHSMPSSSILYGVRGNAEAVK